jgi:hypothetical protein
MALFATGSSRRMSFWKYERIRRALGAARLKLFTERDLLRT